jgi:hypothetical protein
MRRSHTGRPKGNGSGYLAGWTARNEEEAFVAATTLKKVNRLKRMEDHEAKKIADAKAKITLPKFKFMEEPCD